LTLAVRGKGQEFSKINMSPLGKVSLTVGETELQTNTE